MERNDLRFNNHKWDAKKTQQEIWQSLLAYARSAWDIACKDVDINDDALGKHDEIWGGNAFLCYTNNIRTMNWNIRAPNVGLVGHV